jgi:hypothetical protein
MRWIYYGILWAGRPAPFREVDMNVLNATCAVVAITSLAAGCATSAPASDSVRATTSLDEVAGCNLLGKVIVSDTDPNPAKAARDKVASLGGNVLLRKNDTVWNGNAYQCAAAGH